jgi:hypothetical protein
MTRKPYNLMGIYYDVLKVRKDIKHVNYHLISFLQGSFPQNIETVMRNH